MILGPTGSGKELVARALHLLSPRRTQTLYTINCSQQAGGLAESQLFGHSRGAFTGAVGDEEGMFVRAHGSTLFMDELGELALPVQAALLRTVELGEVVRVGDGRLRHVDVRLVTATKEDIDARVRAGTFRDDLYARLDGEQVRLPALCERREDIMMLAAHFARLWTGGEEVRFSPGAREKLVHADWPHNVRQLQKEVGRALINAKGHRLIDATHLELRPVPVAPGAEKPAAANQAPGPSGPMVRPELATPDDRVRTAGRTLEDIQNEIYAKALARHEGNGAAAARELGIQPITLYRWKEQHGHQAA
ncbi:MAG: sigma 54-interacting transcriptional regulator, partial [Deltaproteobacteria bacterium]|nr:sigma 54-interacting transcriptional regulator [Deltaproteobacteria bacterium]